MEEFVKEMVENVKTFKSYNYETYEIIPDNIKEAIGQETILNDYSYFEEINDKDLQEKAKTFENKFKNIYNKLKKEFNNGEEVYFEAIPVKAEGKEGIMFEIDVFDEVMREKYRYFVEKENLK